MLRHPQSAISPHRLQMEGGRTAPSQLHKAKFEISNSPTRFAPAPFTVAML
ncbi:hypothetical protein FHS96_003104 [Sphingomonas zeicaulis]